MKGRGGDSNTNVIIGLVAGGIICAGIAYLAMPNRRKRFRKELRSTYDTVTDTADDIANRGRRIFKGIRYATSDFRKGDVQEKIRDVLELVSIGVDLWENISTRR